MTTTPTTGHYSNTIMKKLTTMTQCPIMMMKQMEKTVRIIY